MKIYRRLFDVEGYGKEIVVNEVCDFLVGVGFGFQPNTSASSRCGTEVKQDWLSIAFCLRQRGVGVFDPLHSHYVLHL
ncbi:MAG TPA: hypothetical protein VI685_08000 [Candidatus Angelobacter sp.]